MEEAIPSFKNWIKYEWHLKHLNIIKLLILEHFQSRHSYKRYSCKKGCTFVQIITRRASSFSWPLGLRVWYAIKRNELPAQPLIRHSWPITSYYVMIDHSRFTVVIRCSLHLFTHQYDASSHRFGICLERFEGKMKVDLFTEATEDGNTPDAEHEQHGEQF